MDVRTRRNIVIGVEVVVAVALWIALAWWQGNVAYRTGMRLSQAGQSRQAVAAFDRALFWQPGNPWTLTSRGIAHRTLKNYDLALRDFDAALRRARARDKRTANIFIARADTYSALAKHAEAVADYRTALKLAPKNARACNNLAWLLATSRDRKIRNGDDAIHFAVTANKLSQFKNPSHLDTLAAACAATAHYDAAARWELRAAKLVKTKADLQIALQRAKLYTQWHKQQAL